MSSSIVTYTGKVFDPLNPDPELICIEDIAHSLARQCRFTGHTGGHQSVAQHSVQVSDYVSHENALAALLHDSPEVYTGDLSTPMKVYSPLAEPWKKIEDELLAAILTRFGLPPSLPEEVEVVDKLLFAAEVRDQMPPCEPYWTEQGVWQTLEENEACPIVRPWGYHYSKEVFLSTFEELYDEA